MESLPKEFLIVSGVIAMTGTVTNAISLSYFISKVKKTLSNRIFIMLNVFDLLVSLLDFAIVTLGYGEKYWRRPSFRVALAVMHVSFESTAFATCLLSVTRTISLCFPFYQIHKKAIGIVALIFLLQEILRFILKFCIYYIYVSAVNFYLFFDMGLMIVLISIVILVNIVSSILSARKLLKNRNQLGQAPDNSNNQGSRTNTNQKATVTILIISTLFCFFNTIFCIALYCAYSRYDVPPALLPLYYVSLWLAPAINSAINPIIYFIRKEDMRKYIKNFIPKFLKSA